MPLPKSYKTVECCVTCSSCVTTFHTNDDGEIALVGFCGHPDAADDDGMQPSVELEGWCPRHSRLERTEVTP